MNLIVYLNRRTKFVDIHKYVKENVDIQLYYDYWNT
jgi:uncharacterized membrane protein